MKTFVFLIMMIVASIAHSADVNLSWDASAGATGYKVYMSTDQGLTWGGVQDVGNVIVYTYLAIPNTGLILFRVSAYNAQDENIRTDAGAWYNGDWVPPVVPSGIGIE